VETRAVIPKLLWFTQL